MDFTVSARLDGDASGLVAATEQGGDGVDKLADRAVAAQAKANKASADGAAAEQTRAAAVAAAGKATTEAATANDNATQAVAGHAASVAQLSQGLGRLTVDLAAGRTSGTGFVSTIASIASGVVGLAGPLAIAGAGMVAVFAGGIAHADALSARTKALSVELQAFGRSDQLSATNLTTSIDSLASQPGVTRATAGDAAQQFLQAGVFDPTLVNRGLQEARNLSLALGGDLTSAAKTVAGAISGSGDSLDKLDSKLHILNDSERVQIRSLQELGQQQQASSVVLDALGQRFDGLGDKALTAGQKISSSIGDAWTRALDAFSQTAPVQAAASAIKAVGDGIADALGPKAGTATQQLAAFNSQIAALNALNASGRGNAGGQVQLRSLQDQRTALQQQMALAQANNPYGPGQGSINADSTSFQQQADDATTRVRTLIEALDDVPRKNDAVHNALARLTQDFAEGKIAAEQYGTAAGLLGAQLDKIRSPVEQSAIDAGNAQARSETSRQQRAYLQFMQGAREQSRGIPETGAGGSNPRQEFIDEKSRQFTIEFDQQSRDAIDDLRSAAQNTLDAVKAYAAGPAAALRQQALGQANDAVRTGRIAPEAAGAYAQENLNSRAASQVLDFAGSTQAYGEQTAALQRLVDAEAQGGAAAREAERTNQVATASAKLRAAAEASGSDTIQQAAAKEIAAYDAISQKAADAQRQREAQQLNNQFDPNAQYNQEIAKLADLQATGVLTQRTIAEASKRYEQQRLDASRDATDGMIAGLSRYADEATNAGQQAASGIRSAMSSAEDAVVQFATTGTISVNNLANAIINDFARIAIRTAITGPATDFLSGLLNAGIKGFIGALGGGFGQPGGASGMEIYHSGGIVGVNGMMRAPVPLAAWAGARRYHDGGVVLAPGEVPIIAQKGERVLTKAQQESGGGSMSVTVINQAPVKVTPTQSRTANGLPSLSLLIEPLEKAMAANIGNGRGPLTQAIGATFGVTPIGRG